MIATPNDAEIIIDIDTNAQKLDEKLEKILDQYSKKKIELDLELKNQSNIRKSLVELDHLMNKLGIPSDEMKKEFDKLSNSLSDSAGKVFKLKEELKSLGKEYKDNLKIIAYKSIMDKLSPNKQIAGLLPSNVKRYINVEIETNPEKFKKKLNKIDQILHEYSNKKVQLDFQLKENSKIKSQLKNLGSGREFDVLKSKLIESTSIISKLREEVKLLGKQYRISFSTAIIEASKLNNYIMSMHMLWQKYGNWQRYSAQNNFKLLPNKQIAGLLPANVTKYINIEIETNPEKFKKNLNKIDQILREYSNKKIQLDFQLKENSKLKTQLKDLGSGREFDALKTKLIESTSIISRLREEVKLLGKQYRISFLLAREEAARLNNYIMYMHMLWQKYSNKQRYSKQIAGLLPASVTKEPIKLNQFAIGPKINIANIEQQAESSSKSIDKIKNKISEFFNNIKNGFINLKANAISASNHVDYFSRRILNLLRNAFVFNVISRQFRGLSALIGNLINRDTIFVRTLMMVKANIIRAFAPIWQVVLPWIRLLGEGLLWLSKIFIKFINFLTGSKIKPVETFKESKQVVDDFYKIASPKKEMFNLEKPVKNVKKIKDGSKKTSNNTKKLSKNLNKSRKESNKILASFDKLETLKFDKNKLAKDPFGLEELKNPNVDKNLNNPIDLDIDTPSIESQIADAINNIEDKPLDFHVNDNIADQITSQVNGLTLPTLEFEVDENSQSWVDKFKQKFFEFYNWILPLLLSLKKFFVSLGDSFLRLFTAIEENGTLKLIINKFTEWKEKLTNFFNTISNNQDKMDKLRNFIVGIGAAFITYSIVSKVFKLVKGFATLASILTGSPIGWISLIGGALSIAIINLDKFKNKFPNLSKAFEDLFTGVSKKITELSGQINNDLKESIKWLEEKAEGILHWLEKHPGVLKTIQWIVERIVDQFGIAYNITKGLLKSIGQFIDKIGGIFNGTRSFADLLAPWGGKEYSRPLPPNLPKLPHLAQGSVLKGGDPFLAYLNDQPRGQTNVEAPLSTIVDAFRQAMSEGSFGQSNINIEASGDMSSIVRLLNFKIKDENNRIGNAFVNDIHI